ncbi:serine protease inhibitor 3/4 isoform X2 [Microplitis demolitor]|uniref:serine protease inhibitor 3/4 isoform X2 n=1 Tax=Microplitis demolitor TaxID=69319 RepID=UPI0004CD8286|nr:serine protease inhibitor 3/4 isoform X2 [Microplitis demolitor]
MSLNWIINTNNRQTTTTVSPVVTTSTTQKITTPAPVVDNNKTKTASITEDEKMQAIRNISSSINQFSIKLHQAMAEKTNGSFISSPLSAAMVYMMAAYGARGKSADEMNSMLHFDTNNSTYNVGINSLITMFDTPNPIGFKLANKIYAGKDQEIKSDYKSLVNETFKSSIENVDFGLSDDTMTKINNWRAEKLHQRITNVIEPDEVSADTELFFINSLYFSTSWKSAFDKTRSKQRNFDINKNETIKQTVMYNTDFVSYYIQLKELNISAFIIEFKRDSKNDELMKFILVRPNYPNISIYDVERNLHKLQLSNLDHIKNSSDVEVPKFRIESTINLKDMFNQSQTNFSGISKQGSELKMDRVVQKLTFEINEFGIEAAVHSEASLAKKTENNGPPFKQIPVFTTDPFVLLITYNDTIIFTGRFIGK